MAKPLRETLESLLDGRNLSEQEAFDLLVALTDVEMAPAMAGALLAALRAKGVVADEVRGFARGMRSLSRRPSIPGGAPVSDVVGTGGDGANLFNISTASAFVVAAAGAYVAKHGNRGVSSTSGSADVLEKLGVRIGLPAEIVARGIEELGVGFMFAPAHHSAMRHAIGPRREMGLRTVFNILGPMTNPAGVKRLVIGVYDDALCRPVAEVLMQLGAERVLVVHSADGLDEISAAASTHLVEGGPDGISECNVTPADFGLPVTPLEGLEVGSALESLELIRAALSGAPGDRAERARRVVALNAGAALYVAGMQASLAAGVAEAQRLLQTGKPWLKVEALADFTAAL